MVESWGGWGGNEFILIGLLLKKHEMFVLGPLLNLYHDFGVPSCVMYCQLNNVYHAFVKEQIYIKF